ncbi:hypothetical protein HDV06_002770 [Boothiomyces sp. JEL0866]|nr:hypothetical protein HDV06_002770 [Boothiomyces sp. JEL0866]
MRSRDLEKQYRQTLKQFGISDHKTIIIVNKFRESLLQDLLNDFNEAYENNTEHSIWKISAYKIIEEYRKKLKQEKNSQLSSSFRLFLVDASGFYLSLLFKLNQKYGYLDEHILNELQLVNENSSPEQRVQVDKDTQDRLVQFYYKSLIYLGDLARYRETHAEKRVKEYKTARKFYKMSLLINPNVGNPFNQLAVLDTYESREISAVEMYFRSLVVENPFPTAKDNLKVMFQKIKQKNYKDDRENFIANYICILEQFELNDIFESYRFQLNKDELKSILITSISILYVNPSPELVELTCRFCCLTLSKQPPDEIYLLILRLITNKLITNVQDLIPLIAEKSTGCKNLFNVHTEYDFKGFLPLAPIESNDLYKEITNQSKLLVQMGLLFESRHGYTATPATLGLSGDLGFVNPFKLQQEWSTVYEHEDDSEYDMKQDFSWVDSLQ